MKAIAALMVVFASLASTAGSPLATCSAADNAGVGLRRPVVAIPDYLPTNELVAVKRGMTEALLKAGFLPVVLPEIL